MGEKIPELPVLDKGKDGVASSHKMEVSGKQHHAEMSGCIVDLFFLK